MFTPQVVPAQAELIEHCFEETGTDFLLAILQGGEPITIIQATMAALAMPRSKATSTDRIRPNFLIFRSNSLPVMMTYRTHMCD
jgi:hypothetical protein